MDYSKQLKLTPWKSNTPMNGRKITLKDGRTVDLTSLTLGDADRLLEMLSQMSDDALKWSMAPYRRAWVEKWLNTPTLIHIAAKQADEIVGFVCIDKFTHPKRRGVGYLGTYFHRDYSGSGLENFMMKRVLDLARQEGIHKVDVGAVADDEDTIGLLERFGFEKEGRKKDDFLGDDRRYHDILAMGRILDKKS